MHDLETTNQRGEAMALHAQIIATAQAIEGLFVEFCRQLKTMRDRKLYIDLGYDTFDEYVEEECGFKARQAYTYISTYEKLGSEMLEKHADAGITKLALLTQITPPDRAEFAEQNDLCGMSVSEIKELIEEKNGLSEQISMLQEKLSDAESERKGDIDDLETQTLEIERLEGIIEEQNSAMAQMKQKPIEVALVGEKRDRAIAEEAKQEAEKEYKAMLLKETMKVENRMQKHADAEYEKLRAVARDQREVAQNALKDALEKLAAKTVENKELALAKEMAETDAFKKGFAQAKEQVAHTLKKAEKDAAEAIEKARRQVTQSTDTQAIKLSLLFASLQDTANKMAELVQEATAEDPEKGKRLQAASFAALTQLVAQFAPEQ